MISSNSSFGTWFLHQTIWIPAAVHIFMGSVDGNEGGGRFWQVFAGRLYVDGKNTSSIRALQNGDDAAGAAPLMLSITTADGNVVPVPPFQYFLFQLIQNKSVIFILSSIIEY